MKAFSGECIWNYLGNRDRAEAADSDFVLAHSNPCGHLSKVLHLNPITQGDDPAT